MSRFPHASILLTLALLGTVFLFVGGPEPHWLRSFSYAWGLGHIVCFALWSYLYANFRRERTLLRVAVEVLLLTFVLGGASEIIQSFVGRQASWEDIWRDLLGALVGLLLFSGLRHQAPRRLLAGMQIVVLALVVHAAFPLGIVIVDDLIAFRQFPLLSGFETPFEHLRWGDGIVRRISGEQAFSGGKSLRIELDTQLYSGIGLNSSPSNWSAFLALSMQVYNPDAAPLLFYLRIHDQVHNQKRSDRFQQAFLLGPGWNHLEVPLDQVAAAPAERRIDLTRIGGLWIYAMQLEDPRVIFLDDVRLVK